MSGRGWRFQPFDGRGDWIRTSDPHTPSVMRYQAALRPDRPGAAASAAVRKGRDLGLGVGEGKGPNPITTMVGTERILAHS